MKLECPHCGQRLEADDEQAGEIVPCPKCNQDMTLPGPPEKSPETDLPSSGFGTCPECGAGLKVQNPVICVNCGHRFRENPQENKSGKKKTDPGGSVLRFTARLGLFVGRLVDTDRAA